MLINTLPNIVDIINLLQNYIKFIEIAAKHKVKVICQKPLTNSLAEAKKATKIEKNIVSRSLFMKIFVIKLGIEKLFIRDILIGRYILG